MVKLDVTLNKEDLLISGVIFDCWHAKFKEKQIPVSFAFLIIDPKTREEAIKLLDDTLAETKMDEAITDILQTAGKEGMQKARGALEKIILEKPGERARFYRSSKTDRAYHSYNAGEHRLVLVKGFKAFSFATGEDLKHLPPNVYCAEENVWYTMDKATIAQASTDLDSFFNEINRITKVKNHDTYSEHTLLKAFFENPESYHKLIADAETYAKFFTSALECPEGYLVYKDETRGWHYGYLITRKGDIFRFARRGCMEQHHTVMAAVDEGVKISNLRREYPTQSEMAIIAKNIGNVDAALSLALLPNNVAKH